MPHCDEETLSLLALGESGPATVEAHIAECEHCRADLSAQRLVVATVRAPDARPGEHPLNEMVDEVQLGEVARIAPPPRVWDQIAAATGVRFPPQQGEVIRHVSTDVRADPATVTATPAPLALPRPRSWVARLDVRLLAVAAVCLVIGVLCGVFGPRLLSSDSAAPLVAATKLAGLPAAPAASGQADITESAQNRTLALNVHRLGPADGFYEVWLIDPTVTKMVPIGVLSGSEGRFTLPAGVNLADYPVVDVSIEPLDGNPAHSGKSVLRGTLRS